MSNQQTPEKTVIEEVVENLVKRTELLEKELREKNQAILAKEKQTQVLLANFENRMSNITIEAPKPDMSMVTAELDNSLSGIKSIMEKWPVPFKKQYHFSLFPEQLRSVEYVRAVLTRVILGIIGLVFLIFTYLLLDKQIQ